MRREVPNMKTGLRNRSEKDKEDMFTILPRRIRAKYLHVSDTKTC